MSFETGFENWTEGLTEACRGFQADLSCLVDGELDDAAAARAMMHLELCGPCREFFEDTRRQVRLHRDMADPERLFARVAMLTGSDLAAEAEGIDLAHRLATVFYQLGKAYTLAAIDPDALREQVFEEAVPVASTKTRGRGFVDGVLQGGKGSAASVDWRHARHLLNGRLEQITDPLEKGRRLLEEAVAADPSHEEARIYLAYLCEHDGKRLKAAERYRDVFDSALRLENRVHAAIQLGRLYNREDDRRRALTFWRWVVMNEMDSDERFWFVRFNIGFAYALERKPERALGYFRDLLDRFPGRAGDLAQLFVDCTAELRHSIQSQEGFAAALVERCPELFQGPSPRAEADA